MATSVLLLVCGMEHVPPRVDQGWVSLIGTRIVTRAVSIFIMDRVNSEFSLTLELNHAGTDSGCNVEYSNI